MTTQMLAVHLQDLVPEARQTNIANAMVTGLQVDSRKVQPGDCFLAFPGHTVDGREYIKDALARGAVVVVAEAQGLQQESELPIVAVDNLQRRLGEIAGRFYRDPSSAMSVVAVTGTNGKTTVTQLVAHALVTLGRAAGVIGTLGNGPVSQMAPTSNTTPDAVMVNALLWQMQQAGVNAIAMEASSHGLVQGRLDGLTIHTGVITNLSRDHLDYHGSMEAYRDAKALLAQHPSLRCLIVNADDPVVAGMARLAHANCRIMMFSLDPQSSADIKAESVNFSTKGLVLNVVVGAERSQIESQLVGEFNAANLLAALAALLSLGFELRAACKALASVAPVAGRMQVVVASEAAGQPAVVVDFAHTPDALEKVLVALRRHCKGALWCVFGCGGDRDVGKRPLMGSVAARYADRVIVTSDNPRSERPARIIADIVKGIPVGVGFEIIEDRTEAIRFAIANAASIDMVLLAGKGHEDYQEVAGVKHPFSDVDVASHMLALRPQAPVNVSR